MIYATIAEIDKPLSRFVYGTPRAVTKEFSEEVYDLYDMAWAKGFRAFDTANSYGMAEENLGRWILKSGHRAEMVLLDKGCNPGQNGSSDVYSPKTIRDQLTRSLDKLNTDYTDLYILHRDDESRPIEEIVDVLNEQAALGRIKRFGGSNFKLYRVQRANAYANAHGLKGFSVLSPNFCLARLVNDPWGGSVTISGDENKDFRDWLSQNQMPVFNYSGLGRGFLSGKYKTGFDIHACLPEGPIKEYYAPENTQRLARAEKLAAQKGVSTAAIALAWLLSRPLNLFPIICPTGETHIDEALKAFEVSLTQQEADYLYYGL